VEETEGEEGEEGEEKKAKIETNGEAEKKAEKKTTTGKEATEEAASRERVTRKAKGAAALDAAVAARDRGWTLALLDSGANHGMGGYVVDVEWVHRTAWRYRYVREPFSAPFATSLQHLVCSHVAVTSRVV
jgi:hypothetical protein